MAFRCTVCGHWGAEPLFEPAQTGTDAFADRSPRITFLASDQGSYSFGEQRKPASVNRRALMWGQRFQIPGCLRTVSNPTWCRTLVTALGPRRC
jgi:hypothetical protein